MKRKIIVFYLSYTLLLLLVPVYQCLGQINFDFDTGLDASWVQSPEGRWGASAEEPINGSGSIHHTFDNAGNGRDRIATSLYPLNPDSGVTTWQFQVRHGYAPSGSNNWGIFLLADASADKMAPGESVNGYVAGVNFQGTDDIIKLWKVTEGSISEIINTGINWQTTVGTNIAAGFFISRTPMGEWTFEVDTNGGFDALIVVGTGADATHIPARYFGVSFEYSSTQDQQLWLDDITIDGAFIPDQTPPAVLNVSALDSVNLKISFSEPVDTISASLLTNYQVNNQDYPININTQQNPDIILTFSDAFQENDSSTLSILGIEDIYGNISNNLFANFMFFSAKKGFIVINEIFADPFPPENLPEYEFIELFNNSPYTINLQNWIISVGTTEKVLPEYQLEPSAFIILAHEDGVASYSAYGSTLGVFTSATTLTNGGADISLESETQKTIDAVTYSNTWYDDETKSPGGWSLERIDPENFCLTELNWSASKNPAGGTPGMENSIKSALTDNTPPYITSMQAENDSTIILTFSESINKESLVPELFAILEKNENPELISTVEERRNVILVFPIKFIPDTFYTLAVSSLLDDCGNEMKDTTAKIVLHFPQPGDIIINEIMADPEPTVSLPEGEYVELFNRSDFPINLHNWSIIAGNTTKQLPTTIDAGGYLILCHEDFVSEFKSYGNVLGIFTSYSTLTNAGTTIALLAADSMQIDQVTYSNSWITQPEKSEGGWSLARIDPDNLCGGEQNWKAAEAEAGGTPGKANAILASNPDNEKPAITEAYIYSMNEIIIEFSEPVADSILLNPDFYRMEENLFFTPEKLADNTVSLIFNDSITTELRFTIRGIADACGNILQDTSLLLYFYTASPYEVIFTEIMANPTPSVNLPEVEYLEILNRSNTPFQLKDWQLTTGNSVSVFPPTIIHPGEYKILCDPANAWLFNASEPIAVGGFNTLSNSGATLVLANSIGRTIHAVDYSANWYGDDFKSNGGWSLEIIDTENPCGGITNWTASNDETGGTPGSVNSVKQENPDLEMPALERVGVSNDSTLLVFFSEPLDSLSLTTQSTYTISPSVGSIVNITPIAPFYNQVELQLDKPFEESQAYTLTVSSSFTDCAGNNAGTEQEVQFALPQQADTFDIVINEILFNPVPGGADFVELYNRSSKVIDLADLLIASFDENTYTYKPAYYISQSSYLFFPETYVVLSENPRDIMMRFNVPDDRQHQFINMDRLPSFPDTEGRVAVLTKTAQVIDDFFYSEDMHFSLLDINEGVSLERIHYHGPTNNAGNWHSAAQTAGFGTPGSVNSQFNENPSAKDGSFTLTPDIFSPDNDGVEDLALLTYSLNKQGYVANIQVYEAAGRTVHKLAQNFLLGISGTITWDGTYTDGKKATPGIYLFYIELFHPEGDVRKIKKTIVLSGRKK